MGVEVLLPDAEPNGLAAMIGGLIEANLRDHPERVALLGRAATYAITARDAHVSVSLRLEPHRVTVRNGLVGSPDVAIDTVSEDLIGLSSVPLRFGLPDLTKKEGRAVNRKLLSGELKVRGLLRHPRKLARLNKLLSVS